MSSVVESSKYDAIVSSARADIEVNGIVGLRVQEVARQADCSVSLIYRHFVSRDGLIAHVLTEDYARNVERWEAITADVERGTGPVDYGSIIDHLPMPSSESARRMRWARVQALAASVDNEVLRERLSVLATRFQRASEQLIRTIVKRNGVTTNFDASVFTQLTMTFAFMLIHNELQPADDQMDDARFRAFLLDLISRYLS